MLQPKGRTESTASASRCSRKWRHPRCNLIRLLHTALHRPVQSSGDRKIFTTTAMRSLWVAVWCGARHPAFAAVHRICIDANCEGLLRLCNALSAKLLHIAHSCKNAAQLCCHIVGGGSLCTMSAALALLALHRTGSLVPHPTPLRKRALVLLNVLVTRPHGIP